MLDQPSVFWCGCRNREIISKKFSRQRQLFEKTEQTILIYRATIRRVYRAECAREWCVAGMNLQFSEANPSKRY